MINTVSASSKGRLLIIDDEFELLEVLAAILEDSTSEIHRANNGIEGIDLLKTQQFDAVLSDEKMPKKSGLEVLKWMRENGLQIPFIIHTGYGQKDMVLEAQRLGVYAFIDKPWDENSLISTVERALKTGMEQKKA
ncbi:response regulator [Bdellovibrio bacteriovorus]|nr:response regulator [Bdellovibrio bacteriovorus]